MYTGNNRIQKKNCGGFFVFIRINQQRRRNDSSLKCLTKNLLMAFHVPKKRNGPGRNETLQTVLIHALGILPEPEHTHRFC